MALRMDVLFAADADSKHSRIDAAMCDLHFMQPAGGTLKIADRVMAIAGVLESIQLIILLRKGDRRVHC